MTPVLSVSTLIPAAMLLVVPPAFLRWMLGARRIVETVIGQLTERFQIENNRARTPWHLVSRIYRKIAAHSVCLLLNRGLGRPLLQLNGRSSV